MQNEQIIEVLTEIKAGLDEASSSIAKIDELVVALSSQEEPVEGGQEVSGEIEKEAAPCESEPVVALEKEASAEEPVAEEPVAEEPVAEEPVAEEPVVEETVTEEPVAEEPVTEEPVVEETVTEEPVVEEPVSSDIAEQVSESIEAEQSKTASIYGGISIETSDPFQGFL